MANEMSFPKTSFNELSAKTNKNNKLINSHKPIREEMLGSNCAPQAMHPKGFIAYGPSTCVHPSAFLSSLDLHTGHLLEKGFFMVPNVEVRGAVRGGSRMTLYSWSPAAFNTGQPVLPTQRRQSGPCKTDLQRASSGARAALRRSVP